MVQQQHLWVESNWDSLLMRLWPLSGSIENYGRAPRRSTVIRRFNSTRMIQEKLPVQQFFRNSLQNVFLENVKIPKANYSQWLRCSGSWTGAKSFRENAHWIRCDGRHAIRLARTYTHTRTQTATQPLWEKRLNDDATARHRKRTKAKTYKSPFVWTFYLAF